MSDEKQVQVISITIHNPHAPNIRCGVMVDTDPSSNHSHYERCPDVASMAMVEPADDKSNRYYLQAFCDLHWKRSMLSRDALRLALTSDVD